jgi:misacylated tRNA(Ala) deacylase
MSEKNYDPRMHTAEHILNQTMVRMFDCPRSRNSHIERKKSKCDYHIPFEPNPKQILEIEEKVNQVIASHVDVTEESVHKSDASAFLDLSKLPENAPELIRVVRVGNYDACACIGPHVKNTTEIGTFKIISHSYEEGLLRLRFKLS